FQEFLARQEREEGPLPFGRIELHLWATAVKRPGLAGLPPRPREPYGVAELFHLCLEAARGFRERRRRSGRLLAWTVVGTSAVVVGIVGLTLALLAGFGPKERRPGDLESQVESQRAREGRTVAERLQGDPARVEERIALLEDLQRNPEFATLPLEE